MNNPSVRHGLSGDRRGSMLIVVLVAIVMLSLAAYTFTALMQTEDEASRLTTRRIQSKYLVDSGVDYVRLFLSYDRATILEKGGVWDNEAFGGIPVVADPNQEEVAGRFTVIAPAIDDEGNPEGSRLGISDESSRLNLNILPFMDNYSEGFGRQLLMALPEMTEEIADAIIDWIDEDDEPRESGAERSAYIGQNPAYEPKNGPLDSLDELLLIRGVTPQLLFGKDTNRNGIIDRDEETGDSSLGNEMDLGWANYMTLYSKESNINRDGLELVNINGDDLEQLRDDLGAHLRDDLITFILYYRENGPATFVPDDEEDQPDPIPAFPEMDFDSMEGGVKFENILDLVDSYTTMPDPEDAENELIIASPISMAKIDFGLLLLTLNKSVSTAEGESVPGRINIMQAPRIVLGGIPGMTDELLEDVITYREFQLDDPEGADQHRKYPTWLLIEGRVDLATMKTLYPFICTGGDVFRAEVFGYFDDGVGTSRAEVILDTTVPIPRILFWRDKSHLQTAYDVDTLGRDLIE